MMASSDDSTMAASSSLSSSARRFSVDVAEDEDDARDVGPVIDDGGGTVVDRGLLAVPGDEHRVVCEADDVPVAEDLLDRVLDRQPGRLVDDAEDVLERLARLPRRAASRRASRPPGSGT